MRTLLAALSAALVLAAVLGAAWWLLEQEGEEEVADPGEVASAYAQAWADGDHERAARAAYTGRASSLTTDEVVAVLDEWRDALGPDEVSAELGELVEQDDGTATVPLETTWRLPYGESPLRWEVELDLLRAQGRWHVDFSHDDVHPELEPGLVVDVETVDVGRAEILARDGTPLATAGDQVSLGLQPGAVDDADALIDAYADVSEEAGEAAAEVLDRDDLVDEWFYPVVELSAERADDLDDALQGVSGVVRRTGEGRSLLEPGFARHVVGVVDEATAEQLEELGAPYEPGDEVGQLGLERALEPRLRGHPEVRVLLRDGEGGPERERLAELSGQASGPVETTLDVTAQRAVERALIGVEGPAAVVVVDPATGEVRASASRPLEGYNRAFTGAYPPGSTMKVVTLAALLADGRGPDDAVDCPGTATLGGLEVTNAGDLALGETTLSEAFAQSCNTTFGTLAIDLGAEAMTAAAERFGFGEEPSLPLAARGGQWPQPGDDAELGAAAFGQARVLASPLHMATVAAAAVDGTWRPPRLLEGGTDDGTGDETEGGTEDEPPTAPEPRELDARAAELLPDLLRTAVTDGTGQAADTVGGMRGKTGTAEADDGVEHAWFIGAVDDLALAVLVEDGGAGGQAAAPIAGRLAAELDALAE